MLEKSVLIQFRRACPREYSTLQIEGFQFSDRFNWQRQFRIATAPGHAHLRIEMKNHCFHND